MTRYLIVSAGVGSGHGRAAQALQAWIARQSPRAVAEHVDILQYTDPAYRSAYTASYLQLARRAPALWGYLYASSDHGRVRFKPPAIVRAFDKLEFARFRHFVRDFAPDHLICTHFLPVQVLASSRRKTWARFSISIIVTDYYAHGFWAQPAADAIFLPTDECLEEVVDRGLDRKKLHATGIPVLPQFARPESRKKVRRALGLDASMPVVLVMGGGWGGLKQADSGGGLAGVVGDVLAGGKTHVLAVAGRNAKAKAELDAMNDDRLHVFGFVDNVHELMAASDLCVTKSGGLTTAECLAMGLPMLIPSPIPGQEERNADFATEAGAAMQARSAASLRLKLKRLIADTGLRDGMRAAARAAARPLAGAEIIARVNTLRVPG